MSQTPEKQKRVVISFLEIDKAVVRNAKEDEESCWACGENTPVIVLEDINDGCLDAEFCLECIKRMVRLVETLRTIKKGGA